MFLGLIGYLIATMLAAADAGGRSAQFTGGGAAAKSGASLFTVYLLPFEVTSVLILIAILGAIVLARKEID